MKITAVIILLIGTLAFASEGMKVKDGKWDIRDQAVDSFSMIPPKKSADKFAPAAMLFDLAGKPKSIAVSLCGPTLIVESGADLPSDTLGSLSAEKIEGVGWFSPLSQVVDGRVILRVNTQGEKEILDKEIKEFQERHSCSYL